MKPRRLDTPSTDALATRKRALDLLARREHSRLELHNKLVQRGFAVTTVEVALDQLEQESLLSDHRFAEAYLRSRMERGFGPLRIRQELEQRGIGDEMIAEVLTVSDSQWIERAGAARFKRFGGVWPESFVERSRQMRFLSQRGFSGEQIQHLFRHFGSE